MKARDTLHILVAAALAAGCSRSPATPANRIVVAITVDWEGAELAPDELDALADVRRKLGAVPFTHFVSAAYATKKPGDRVALATIARAIHPGDELAVHLHAWRTLAAASGVEPRLSPSFLTGTDEVVEFADDDAGFDTDLDTYDVPALRALLRTSRQLLEQTHLPVSRSFRAGGYLGTPKVLLAIADEGYAVDSSANVYRGQEALADRTKEVWPHIEPTTQPFLVEDLHLVEMPIAAVADDVSVADMVQVFDAAHARLRQGHDVFVVLAMHLETASDFGGRIVEAIGTARGRHPSELTFMTIEQAAELASFELAPAR